MNGPGDFLIFELDGAAYGLDAALVAETLWLPELAPADEAPPGVVGLFNLRGALVPVLDLAARLGHGPHHCRTSDQLVVLAAEGEHLAVIVDAVRDLAHLSAADLLPPPDYERLRSNPLVTGSAQAGDTLVTLLDGRVLARQAGGDDWLAAAAGEERFCQGCTAEEHGVFRRRAEALRQAAADETTARQALAVVDIGGQCFAIELAAVRQFCRVGGLRPLPCCPPHVAGVFSLRGNLVTLLELGGALNLPPPPAPRAKAVIGSIGGQGVALAVDEVLDVIWPRPEELEPPPPEIARRHGAEIRAIAAFGERRAAVLDLPGLLAREDWIVDETVS